MKNQEDISRVKYRLIQVVKIMTVRFDDNLRLGEIQGDVTINREDYDSQELEI